MSLCQNMAGRPPSISVIYFYLTLLLTPYHLASSASQSRDLHVRNRRRPPHFLRPAPTERQQSKLSCRKYSQSADRGSAVHTICDSEKLRFVNPARKNNCSCEGSDRLRFSLSQVGKATAPDLIKSAYIHLCLYPTAWPSLAKEENRMRLRLNDMATNRVVADVLLDPAKSKCTHKNNCKPIRNNIFSRRCSWVKLDTTRAVRVAMEAKRTELRLLGRLSALNCTSSARSCLSWTGGHLEIPYRFIHFLVLHYKDARAVRGVSMEPGGRRECRSHKDWVCRLRDRLGRLHEQGQCRLQNISLGIYLRAYEALSGEKVRRPRHLPAAVSLLQVCGGGCLELPGLHLLDDVRKKFGLSHCLPTGYGEEKTVDIEVDLPEFTEKITKTWRVRSAKDCTCGVPKAANTTDLESPR